VVKMPYICLNCGCLQVYEMERATVYCFINEDGEEEEEREVLERGEPRCFDCESADICYFEGDKETLKYLSSIIDDEERLKKFLLIAIKDYDKPLKERRIRPVFSKKYLMDKLKEHNFDLSDEETRDFLTILV